MSTDRKVLQDLITGKTSGIFDMAVTVADVILPSNPQDLKDILSELDSIVDSMTRIAGEREFIKATINALAEKHEIPKKILNQMARIHFNRNITEVQDENDTLVEAYNRVTGNS